MVSRTFEAINTISGVHFSWIPFLCDSYKTEPRNVVVVTHNNRKIYTLSKLQNKVSNFDTKVIELPEFEIYNDQKINTSRAAAFYNIQQADRYILFATIKSLSLNLPDLENFKFVIDIRVGQAIGINLLAESMTNIGYERSEITERHGQFSVRGGIIDVFPVTSDFPHRIDFFGNNVESIKLFDTEIQTSIGGTESITITRAVENRDNCCGRSLVDQLNTNSIFIYDFEVSPITTGNTIKILPFENYQPFAKHNNFFCNVRTEDGFKEFVRHSQLFEKVVVSVISNGAIHVISDIFKSHKFNNFQIIEHFQEATAGKISIIRSEIAEGFIKDSFCIYTEMNIIGYVLRTSSRNLAKKNIFKNYESGLRSGDYVVHKKHGIALFNGLVNLDVNGIPHDFLSLTYRDNDKLFVPVENIDLVSRYGGDESSNIELDRLSSSSAWNNRKENVYKKLLVIADELLKTAANRKLHKVDPIVIDDEKYEEFCKRFPYIETDDQIYAIDDVLNDLKNSQTPMDRLICGDVGFGKTEVALRAAFAMSYFGLKQVLILAPTTILVNQHYKTFKARFDGFGVDVCQMSRFVKPHEKRENIAKIANGDIRIVIGTHSLLSSSLKFNDIGMLIIDEEQHFGVKQKEYLKNLQSSIHVMTMTATPIPRTLQMAVSGIKELSIMASPPEERLPVKIYISEFDDGTIKTAIDNELNREGQVFFVSPRIEFLDFLSQAISRMVPNAMIKIAHGKDVDVENTINDFCDKKIQILLSTNIIDSGIDIPNANTIIIHRPDMFGLSQLYQLIGRVGRRPNVQGFAYIMLPSNSKLTHDAQKRLDIIQKLDKLGSGFTLASYDLDIRGAGNIIGDEQSGYIKEVGIELYQSMLERAIMMKDSELSSPQINIGIPALIPEHYVVDSNLRISVYRKIGDITKETEIAAMEHELADRFGRIPVELKNLLIVIRAKILCAKAWISRIDVTNNGVLIAFCDKTPNTEKIMSFVQRNENIAKLKPGNKIVVNKVWRSVDDRTNDIINIIKYIA